MKQLGFVGLVVLASCTSASAASDPKPAHAEEKVIAAMKGRLKDPFSVREFSIGTPYRALPTAAYPGSWNVCVSLYAKNSFGAYNKGFYRVFFRQGQVVDILGGSSVDVKPDCGQMRARPFR